jgi:hypothetical protein
VGEQGARLKRGAGARTWPENARTWARPRRGVVGRRLGTADRWGRRDKRGKRARGREKLRRQAWPTGQRERGGGREGALELVPTGGARLSGTEVTRLSGPVWAEIGFPFSREFLIAFLFIFSRVFNSN